MKSDLRISVKDHRRRNELLCQIMDWINIYGAAVLIFCEETKTDPIKGKIHHGSGGIGKLSVLARNIFHIAEPAEKKEFVDFEKSMAGVDAYYEDESFSELDQALSDAARTAKNDEDDIPSWKPANMEEEVATYNAYMKNHPELVFDKSVVPAFRRDYVMHLIAEEKKNKAREEARKQTPEKKGTLIKTNLPDKPSISSEKGKRKKGEVKSSPLSATSYQLPASESARARS